MPGYGYRRRKKRGVATMLGVLIMVGVLITSILPMFMYVNEVNNYYDRTVVNMKIADDERSMENLEVHAYGHNSTSIDIFIVNRSPLKANITRFWVIRTDLQYTWIFDSTNLPPLPVQLGASAQTTFEGLDLTDILNNNTLKSFNIEATTERGNRFSSLTNPLTYSDGQWQTGTLEFNVQVLVLSTQGQDRYLIEVNGLYNTTHYDWVDSAMVQGQFLTVFNVPEAGTYNVTVSNIKGQTPYFVGNKTVGLNWIYPTAFCQFDDR